jgi:hypothetical protein
MDSSQIIGLCSTYLFSHHHNELKLNESHAERHQNIAYHESTKFRQIFNKINERGITAGQLDCHPSLIRTFQFTNPIGKAERVFSVVIIALMSIAVLVVVATIVHAYLTGTSWITRFVDGIKNYEYELVEKI